MCLAQLRHTANMCAKFPFKLLKNVEVVQFAKFSLFFAMIRRYHGNALSAIVKIKKKRLAHLCLPANMWARFHFKCFENVEVVQLARFPPNFLP